MPREGLVGEIGKHDTDNECVIVVGQPGFLEDVPAGKQLIVEYSTNQTTALTAPTGMDSKGNAYVLLGTSNGTSNRRVCAFRGEITTPLVAGDTITVTQDGAASNRRNMKASRWSNLGAVDRVVANNGITTSLPTSGPTEMRQHANEVGIFIVVWTNGGTKGSMGLIEGAGFRDSHTIESGDAPAFWELSDCYRWFSAVGTEGGEGELGGNITWAALFVTLQHTGTIPDPLNVEMMDPVDVSQLLVGVGINVNPSQLWEFDRALEMGAKEVRFHPDWPSVEVTPGVLAMPATFAAALDKCEDLGLEPLLVAGYGPGWLDLGVLTVAVQANSGQRNIQFNEALPAGLAAFTGHVVTTVGTAFFVDTTFVGNNGFGGTPGAMIDAVDTVTKTITLASTLVVNIAPGTQLILRKRHYRAPGVVTGGSDTNGAIAHYTDYVTFLANEISSRGLTGRVEIWNEPPLDANFEDPWDGGEACSQQDNYGGANCLKTAQYGFAKALFALPAPPAGVKYCWGGPNLSGFSSVHGNEINHVETPADITDRMAEEGFHPYGGLSPEAHGWNLKRLRDAGISSASFYANTALPGTGAGSNYKWGRKAASNHQIANGWSVRQVLTECGYDTSTGVNGPLERTRQARYHVRQSLWAHGSGLKRINWYRLATLSGQSSFYEIINGTTQVPYQAYDCLKAMMADLTALGTSATVGTPPLPTITGYSGSTWPLMVVPIRGAGDAANGPLPIFLTMWQRTYGTAGGFNRFDTLPSPAPETVEVEIPEGMRVAACRNLITRLPVTTTPGVGNRVSLPVTDDPVVLHLEENPAMPPSPLPLAFLGIVGSVGDHLNLATLSITIGAEGVPAGTLLAVCYGSNLGGTDLGESCIDSKGNLYVPDQVNEATSRKNAILRSIITTPLVAGDTITVTQGAASIRRMMTVRKYQGAGVLDRAAVGAGTGNFFTTNPTLLRRFAKEVQIACVTFTGLTGAQMIPGSGWKNPHTIQSGDVATFWMLGSEDRIVTSKGTEGASASLGTAPTWAMSLADYPALVQGIAGGRSRRRRRRREESR